MSPIETDDIDFTNWGRGVCIVGITIINGGVCGYFSLGINDEIHHWVKGANSLHRLISFFELLGNYVGIRLWSPDRLCNTDLMCLEIPIVADKRCNDFIPGNITQRIGPPIGRCGKWMPII